MDIHWLGYSIIARKYSISLNTSIAATCSLISHKHLHMLLANTYSVLLAKGTRLITLLIVVPARYEGNS